MDTKYSDYYNRKYPDPEIEKDFYQDILRAPQFSPFAALTGHDDAIKEKARLVDKRVKLSDDEQDSLNRRLYHLSQILEELPWVSITHFVPDKRKDGGKYETAAGVIYRIQEFEQNIIIDENIKGRMTIAMENILVIESDCFRDIQGI